MLAALSIPEAARAACDVTINPNTVICAADTTTVAGVNLNAAHPSSSDQLQIFSPPGPLTVTINPGINVNGEGLWIIPLNSTEVSVSNAGSIPLT